MWPCITNLSQSCAPDQFGFIANFDTSCSELFKLMYCNFIAHPEVKLWLLNFPKCVHFNGSYYHILACISKPFLLTLQEVCDTGSHLWLKFEMEQLGSEVKNWLFALIVQKIVSFPSCLYAFYRAAIMLGTSRSTPPNAYSRTTRVLRDVCITLCRRGECIQNTKNN